MESFPALNATLNEKLQSVRNIPYSFFRLNLIFAITERVYGLPLHSLKRARYILPGIIIWRSIVNLRTTRVLMFFRVDHFFIIWLASALIRTVVKLTYVIVVYILRSLSLLWNLISYCLYVQHILAHCLCIQHILIISHSLIYLAWLYNMVYITCPFLITKFNDGSLIPPLNLGMNKQ